MGLRLRLRLRLHLDLRSLVKLGPCCLNVQLYHLLFVKDRCSLSGNWSYFEGKCYNCIKRLETWNTARTACQRHSGDLVSIPSQAIQTFLESKISPPLPLCLSRL